MTPTHALAALFFAGLLGILIERGARFVWLNRARIVEALRG